MSDMFTAKLSDEKCESRVREIVKTSGTQVDVQMNDAESSNLNYSSTENLETIVNIKSPDKVLITSDEKRSQSSAYEPTALKDNIASKFTYKCTKEFGAEISSIIDKSYTQATRSLCNTTGEQNIAGRTANYGVAALAEVNRYAFKSSKFVIKSTVKGMGAATRYGISLAKKKKTKADIKPDIKQYSKKMIASAGSAGKKMLLKEGVRGVGSLVSSMSVKADNIAWDGLVKAKDTVVTVQRSAATFKAVAKTTFKAAKLVGRLAIKAGQAVLSAVIANPIVLIVILVFITLIMAVSAISLFISTSFTTDNDEDLNEIYLYIKEKDMQAALRYLNYEIENNVFILYKKEAVRKSTNVALESVDTDKLLNYLSAQEQNSKDFSLKTVKAQIDYAFNLLYQINTHTEKEIYDSVEVVLNAIGLPVKDEFGNYIYQIVKRERDCLVITQDGITLEKYISLNPLKDSEKERFNVFNNIGGTMIFMELKSPFETPIVLSSTFGWRVIPFEQTPAKKELHRGLDIPMPANTPISSTMSGTVKVAYYGHSSYGNYVVIENEKNKTLYAHCNSLNVYKGQKVEAGDVIAYVGSTGDSTGNHLHLEYEKNGVLVNPMFYMERVTGS